MGLADTIRANLDNSLEGTDFSGLGEKYKGKVRDCYIAHGRRTLVVSDRISAFDRVLTTLPFKGQLLNQLSAYWFETTRDIAPNHLLDVPDPQVSVTIDCEPLPVEMVVRAYVTGVTTTSIWTHYEKGGRNFCGNELPDGLVKNQKLPQVILTPSTKASGPGAHDHSASREEILAEGRVSAGDFDRAAEMSMALFAAGQKRCAANGLILVDTKYELGKTPDGQIVFIDEIHTPDSSRYWIAETYEQAMAERRDPHALDKEYVRTFLAEEHNYRGDGPVPPIPDEVKVEAVVRYARAFQMVTGRAFEPNTEEPIARIKRNLGLA